MKRIALTDGSGSWFDLEKSEKFDEQTYWNGSNHISKATGSQWHHEVLFFTSSGKWILNTWSNYQGVADTFTEITEREAATWFSRQAFQADEIPESLHPIIAEMEI